MIRKQASKKLKMNLWNKLSDDKTIYSNFIDSNEELLGGLHIDTCHSFKKHYFSDKATHCM